MAKSLRDRILEALKKESLTNVELSERVDMGSCYFMLSRLEEEELIEYDFRIVYFVGDFLQCLRVLFDQIVNQSYDCRFRDHVECAVRI